jgi:hypothetical protein
MDNFSLISQLLRFGMAKAEAADIGVSFLATLAVAVSHSFRLNASCIVCICFIHFVYIFIEGVVMNAFACSEIHSSSRLRICVSMTFRALKRFSGCIAKCDQLFQCGDFTGNRIIINTHPV